jgi:hypothetical protein
MTTLAPKMRPETACWAIALLALACGGRTVGGGNTDIADSGTPPSDTPAPTCSAICRRAVDLCFPGAPIDQCSSDCEKMRSDYKGCPAVLDTFLRCRMSVPIVCTDIVTFDGCSSEANDLSRCKP